MATLVLEALRENSLLAKVAIGLLVGLLSVLVYRWNSHGAHQDALAYAAKIRQQREEKKAIAVPQDEQPKLKNDDETISREEQSQSVKEEESKSDRGIASVGVTSSSWVALRNEEPLSQLRCLVVNDLKTTETKSEETKTNDQEIDQTDNDNNNSNTLGSNDFQNNTQWRCACEVGFLPPGMLSSLGGAEAIFRMGTGQCYHKQT